MDKCKSRINTIVALALSVLIMALLAGCSFSKDISGDIERKLKNKYKADFVVVMIQEKSTRARNGVPFSGASWYEATVQKEGDDNYFTVVYSTSGLKREIKDNYYKALYEDELKSKLNTILDSYAFIKIEKLFYTWNVTDKTLDEKTNLNDCLETAGVSVVFDAIISEECPDMLKDDFILLNSQLQSLGVDWKYTIYNICDKKYEQLTVDEDEDIIEHIDSLKVDHNSISDCLR